MATAAAPGFIQASWDQLPGQNPNNTECAICFEAMNDNQTSLTYHRVDARVSHVFHTHCMRDWALQSRGPTCPSCRIPIEGASLNRLRTFVEEVRLRPPINRVPPLPIPPPINRAPPLAEGRGHRIPGEHFFDRFAGFRPFNMDGGFRPFFNMEEFFHMPPFAGFRPPLVVRQQDAAPLPRPADVFNPPQPPANIAANRIDPPNNNVGDMIDKIQRYFLISLAIYSPVAAYQSMPSVSLVMNTLIDNLTTPLGLTLAVPVTSTLIMPQIINRYFGVDTATHNREFLRRFVNITATFFSLYFLPNWILSTGRQISEDSLISQLLRTCDHTLIPYGIFLTLPAISSILTPSIIEATWGNEYYLRQPISSMLEQLAHTSAATISLYCLPLFRSLLRIFPDFFQYPLLALIEFTAIAFPILLICDFLETGIRDRLHLARR